MIFKQGTMVQSEDGQQVGTLDRVVIDPRSQSVSHIVVERGFLFTDERVIPINLIASADEEHIDLRLTADDLDDLPEFVETNYIHVPEAGDEIPDSVQSAPFYPVAPMPAWHPGVPIGGYDIDPGIEEEERHIPDTTVTVKKGADVFAMSDEKVGHILEVLTNPESHDITQFVVAEGSLLTEEKRIPIEWVSEIKEDQVRLAVGSKILEYLPASQ